MAEFELRFKSIAVRWFINVFLIVAAVVTVAAVIFCAFLSSMYTERVRALGDDYAYDFSALSKTSVYTFEDTAVKLSETFAHKDKIEVQVMDRRGKMIVSTTGFAPIPKKQANIKRLQSQMTDFTPEKTQAESRLWHGRPRFTTAREHM